VGLLPEHAPVYSGCVKSTMGVGRPIPSRVHSARRAVDSPRDGVRGPARLNVVTERRSPEPR